MEGSDRLTTLNPAASAVRIQYRAPHTNQEFNDRASGANQAFPTRKSPLLGSETITALLRKSSREFVRARRSQHRDSKSVFPKRDNPDTAHFTDSLGGRLR